MTLPRNLLLLAVVATTAVSAQVMPREPRIGYVYPAGGHRGTTVRITVGGQNLGANCTAYWSDTGISATFVEYVKPLGGKQLQDLRKRLEQLRDHRVARATMTEVGAADETPRDTPAPLPEHPMLKDLDKKSNAELRQIADYFFNKKKQPNVQIAESVTLQVSINANVATGMHELRLRTDAGLSNPIRFEVGTLPETGEKEPNDPVPDAAPLPVSTVPAIFNGQILPGDVDRFQFQVKKGQELVFKVSARALMPFMADAVPGWFQPVLALCNADGRRVAESDDNAFDPDPLLSYTVPDDGEYTLVINDALYRGREDFTYRIAAGELPLVTGIFPLGGRLNEPATAVLTGSNLRENRVALDTTVPGMHALVSDDTSLTTSAIAYTVGSFSEAIETEPNDSIASPQPITFPCVVNGVIEKPGDVDVFQLDCAPGTHLVAEIAARRLGSPLDAVMKLVDSAGNVVGLNDDTPGTNVGCIAQHSDSYLNVELTGSGPYHIEVGDTTQHGGSAYAYRLRLTPPQPNFEVYVSPSSVNVSAGRSAPITVTVVRKDGFDGRVDLALENAPGLTLDAPRVPAGKNVVRATITAAQNAAGEPVAVRVRAHATIAGASAEHDAVPADDMMQAFIYHHLVASSRMLVSVQPSRFKNAVIKLLEEGDTRIPVGGSATVVLRVPGALTLKDAITLALDSPPPGIELADVSFGQGQVALQLRANGPGATAGMSDNLLVSIYREPTPDAQGNKPAAKRRMLVGVLPAIPVAVVAP